MRKINHHKPIILTISSFNTSIYDQTMNSRGAAYMSNAYITGYCHYYFKYIIFVKSKFFYCYID